MTASRFTFKSAERLKSKRLIEAVAKGKSFSSEKIRCHYLRIPDRQLPSTAQAAFTVPKRNFKRAVDRNRLKRLMREAYRLEKPAFYEALDQNGIQYAILFVYQGKEQDSFDTVQLVIKTLLSRILADAAKPA